MPQAKRRWGWYVLPILFGDRLVGRIEPRIDRAGGRVQMLASGGRTASRRAAPRASSTRCAMRSARTCASAGATRIEWAPELAMEKRLFLTRP